MFVFVEGVFVDVVAGIGCASRSKSCGEVGFEGGLVCWSRVEIWTGTSDPEVKAGETDDVVRGVETEGVCWRTHVVTIVLMCLLVFWL